MALYAFLAAWFVEFGLRIAYHLHTDNLALMALAAEDSVQGLLDAFHMLIETPKFSPNNQDPGASHTKKVKTYQKD